jgi:flagellum-specific peptidoglycan hydrolase FlgJ
MSKFVHRITINKAGNNNKQAVRSFRIPATLLVICFLFSISFPVRAQSSHYINQHRPLATKLAREYNIPAAIILAVAIVESSSGQARVTRRFHNHFGIAGRNRHKGKKRSRYKAYEDDAASFRDFCTVIAHKRFYPKLKGSTDYKKWISEISKTGYSESPAEWQKRVLHTIAVNHL